MGNHRAQYTRSGSALLEQGGFVKLTTWSGPAGQGQSPPYAIPPIRATRCLPCQIAPFLSPHNIFDMLSTICFDAGMLIALLRSQRIVLPEGMKAAMATQPKDAGLVITVVQATIDFFWRSWDGSSETIRPAIEASKFWTIQAFERHGDWVHAAAEGALHVFLRAHLDDGHHVAKSEDHAVAAVVYQLTGQRAAVI
jgi:hypothetical protein